MTGEGSPQPALLRGGYLNADDSQGRRMQGRGMGAASWAGDHFPGFHTEPQSEERIQRNQRINLAVPFLAQGRLPLLNDKDLERLLKDLKEEGNAVFREKNYSSAGEKYTFALQVGKYLQENHVNIEKEFLSTVFCNRAACCIKMDMFEQGISDCEFALSFNRDNIKAYYRKATALKTLRKYGDAVQVARAGKQRAEAKAKPNEIREFGEMIIELESHLHHTSHTRQASMPLYSRTGPTQQHPQQPQQLAHQQGAQSGGINGHVDSGALGGGDTSRQSPTRAATVSLKEVYQKPASGMDSVDPQWLQGTNVNVNNKPAQPKSKGKGGKQAAKQQQAKAKASKPQKYKGNFDYLQDITDSSSEENTEDQDHQSRSSRQTLEEEDGDAEEEEEEEEEEDAGSPDSGVVSSSTNNSASNTQGNNTPAHSPALKALRMGGQYGISTHNPYAALSSEDPMANVTTAGGARPKQSFVKQPKAEGNMVNEMGLDDFDIAGLKSNYPRNVPSKQAATAPPNKPPPQMNRQQAAPSSTYQQPIPDSTPTSDFKPLLSRHPLAYPFNTHYFFTLVCNKCFVRSSPGPSGFKQYPQLSHKCERDILLVMPKNSPTKQWIKIRPRNTKVNFMGTYRLCQQYRVGEECKIGEAQCSFAHYPEEINLWTLDREDQIDINQFISDQRTNILKGITYHADSPPTQSQDQRNIPTQPQVPFNSSRQVHIGSNPPVSSTQQPPYQQGLDRPGYNAQASRPANQQPPQPPRMQQQQFNMPPTAGYKQPLLQTPQQQPPQQQLPPQQQQQMGNQQRMAFPLQNTHAYKLVCNSCLKTTMEIGLYLISSELNHSCSEDILVVKEKADEVWVKIRERKNHRKFLGRYIMCRNRTGTFMKPCSMGEESCSFAHNEEEQILWTLEKDDQFNITEFILQNRSLTSRPGFTLEVLYQRHPGLFRFLCYHCFFGRPSRVSTQNPHNPTLCTVGGHIWQQSRMLVHMSINGQLTPIQVRPFKHKGAFYLLCHKLQFCLRKDKTGCKFAHSTVERDVWLVERDMEVTRDIIVEQSREFQSRGPQGGLKQQQQQGPQAAAAAAAATAAGRPSAPSPTLLPGGVLHCPYRVIEVCSLCWRQGTKSTRDGTKDSCTAKHPHTWSINHSSLLIPANKVIRSLPKKLPTGNKFVICRHIPQRGYCDFARGNQCQFAHSKEEIEVWTWMVNNKVMTLEDLVKKSSESHKAQSKAAKPIAKGQTVVATQPMTNKPPPMKGGGGIIPLSTPFDLPNNTHYCHYCSVSCNSAKQWDEHCASEKHMFNVNSDKEHQWNYRQPPWGVPSGNYELCQSHLEGKCRYSDKPDLYNYCRYAHTREELDEWKERYEWRTMKREIAKKEGVYSYMDDLLEEYQAAAAGIEVMTEELAGVTVECSTPLSLYQQDKQGTQSWLFDIKSKGGLRLEKVALLFNKDRLHFSLVGEQIDRERTYQIAPGDSFATDDLTGMLRYSVHVQFVGGVFGSFMQWVVFDFGTKPVMMRKLGVELGTQFVQDKVKILREKLTFDRWTSDNRSIVRFEGAGNISTKDQLQEEVVIHYKAPSDAEEVITQQSVGGELNRHNYVHKMHKLLRIEELTRARIIASYNLKTRIELLNSVQEETIVYARQGELFAKVPLNGQLSEDTNAGKLILTSVTTVLLAPQQRSTEIVYEAIILQKQNFDYDGKGRDFIYLCLSPHCVQELGLDSGDTLNVEIQFQMDRVPFGLMHYALDQLPNTDPVFPDVTKLNPAWNEHQVLNISSSVLNVDQLKIVKHIVTQRTGYTPPLVIHGPFGTGKTEAIAQAAMVLAKELPHSKILICTHSNSAADLYILKHFDVFVSRVSPRTIMRRIYFSERRVNTVNSTVLKYCLLSGDRNRFVPPSREDVLRCHIMVTTLNTSLLLSRLDVAGEFTHIFIDEAAQALECEAVMPLGLVTETTCVVMAGDHMQMSPKVYSMEARTQRFDRSLLERIYRHYEAHERHMTMTGPPSILLTINYRTKMEILRFISSIFYGGPDRLLSKSEQVSVEDVIPLTFYTAQGQEVLDRDSTSYYNIAEVEEVVDRVEEVYRNWPEEWGERKAELIGVVTPYADQVNKIRVALRKRKKDLRAVTVERVMNVQGKEFRCLFISTVRTTHLLDNPPQIKQETAECDGDTGDFGFLSDQKLLNTAMTRAQSLVAVIGDPVALCAIGECMTTWRTFLKHCQNMRSIHPNSITLDSVRTQVVSLTNSAQGQRLQRLHRQQIAGGSQQDGGAVAVAGSSRGESQPRQQQQVVDDKSAGPFEMVTTEGVLEDLSLDYKVSGEDVLRQLAREALISGRKDDVRQDSVQLSKEKGHVVVQFQSSSKDKARLLDSGQTPLDSSEEEVEAPSPAHQDLTLHQLSELVRTQPTRFMLCELTLDGTSGKMMAKALNAESPIPCVELCTTKRQGQGLNGDQVYVEVLPHPENSDTQSIPQGNVVRVVKQALEVQGRMFVCTLDEEEPGLMRPINPDIPSMHSLVASNRMQKVRKGHMAVYTFTADQEVIFHHYEPNTQMANKDGQLFVVRFLKWDSKFSSPLGLVVGVLPVGTNIDRSMKILNMEHYVPRRFTQKTLNEVKQLYPQNYTIAASECAKRFDYREKMTFTIDKPGTKILDCAFSIDEIEVPQNNNCFLIGVHVSDIAHFVSKGGAIDQEALLRGAAFTPAVGESTPMLPERLSHELCSLDKGKDRLTVTVFITINAQAEVLRIVPKRCMMRSKHKLHYAEVEALINPETRGQNYDGPLLYSLLMLHQIAQMWRKRRLGNASQSTSLNPLAKDAPAAHHMVDEIKVMASYQLALFLLQKMPQNIPVCVQSPPNRLELDKWRMYFADAARNTCNLTQPFKFRGEVCHCEAQCVCIPAPDMQLPRYMDIQSKVWEQIQQAVSSKNVNQIRSLILNSENHPPTGLAQLALQALTRREEYICSADATTERLFHHSLNMPAYTTFTSPMKRYMDFVVQHTLVACMEGQTDQPPYSQDQLRDICEQASKVSKRLEKYEEATHTLQMSTNLQQAPVTIYPVIKHLGQSSMQLTLPQMPRVMPDQGNLSTDLLGVTDQPEFDASMQMVTFTWHQRIFDTSPSSEVVEACTKASENDTVMVLNPSRHLVKMPEPYWQGFLRAALSGEPSNLMNSMFQVSPHLIHLSQDPQFVADVSSEVSHMEMLSEHMAKFCLKLQPCMVIGLQIAATLHRGITAPCLQLLHLTPTLSICLEHKTNPVNCFTNMKALQSAKDTYPDEAAFQQTWMSLLEAEAAHRISNSTRSLTIHNVALRWTKAPQGYTATFQLPVAFCQERDIGLSSEIHDLDSEAEEEQGLLVDYMCVRYSGLTLAPAAVQPSLLSPSMSASDSVTWVGHCGITSVTEEGKMQNTQLKLVQSTMELPQQVLAPPTDGSSPPQATVEWITKDKDIRCAERAVARLRGATQLAKDIATGRTPIRLEASYLSHVMKVTTPASTSLPALDSAQKNAVQLSLRQPFTIVKGAAGTGKTLLSVQLALQYVQINASLTKDYDKSGVRPQVLLCAPTDATLDVICDLLKQVKEGPPSMVRIYSDPSLHSSLEEPECRHPDIALHQVALTNSSYSSSLQELEEKVQGLQELLLEEQEESQLRQEGREYQRLMVEAEREVLARVQLILCTTLTSQQLQGRSTNVLQLVIDDSSMCSEPETLVPIVASRCHQVVLLGDVQGLQPTAETTLSKKLGLTRSLLERYGDQALVLGTHYRMHETIAALAFQQFYSNPLDCGRDDQTKTSSLKFWPNGRNKPITFVHVVGQEEQVVLTPEAKGTKDKSIVNAEEVTQAVRLAAQLVRRFHVPPGDVAVLSPYAAQTAEISSQLLQRGETQVHVKTITDSQGYEWDYVLVSMVRSLTSCAIEQRPTTEWSRQHLGVAADAHIINTAITRARKGLIIIGNKELLQRDPVWSRLLKQFSKQQKVVMAGEFLTAK